MAFTLSSVTPKRADLDLDFGGRFWNGVQTQESPSTYELTSPSLTHGRAYMMACGSPTGNKPTQLLRYPG